MRLPGAGARGGTTVGQRPGEGEKADEEAGPATKCRPCLAPCPWYQPPSPKSGNHSPPCEREADGRGS